MAADHKSSNGCLIVLVLLGVAGFHWFFSEDEETMEARRVRSAEISRAVVTKPARDAEARFEMVARKGTRLDAYREAGRVAEEYLKLKDEPGYQRWKGIQQQCLH